MWGQKAAGKLSMLRLGESSAQPPWPRPAHQPALAREVRHWRRTERGGADHTLRPNQMPSKAASATSARNRFKTTRMAGGRRGMSGFGGGAPTKSCRQTPATKQKAPLGHLLWGLV